MKCALRCELDRIRKQPRWKAKGTSAVSGRSRGIFLNIPHSVWTKWCYSTCKSLSRIIRCSSGSSVNRENFVGPSICVCLSHFPNFHGRLGHCCTAVGSWKHLCATVTSPHWCKNGPRYQWPRITVQHRPTWCVAKNTGRMLVHSKEHVFYNLVWLQWCKLFWSTAQGQCIEGDWWIQVVGETPRAAELLLS
jgi:hypothetical protein